MFIKNKLQAAFSKKASFSFEALPTSLDELKALPEAAMDDPFKTAALTVCALCAYATDKEVGIEMLNHLRGPRPMSPAEIQFLNDRLMDGKTYIPRSYFAGAKPENEYTPTVPYTVKVDSNQYSSLEGGNYMKLLISSGGADSPRSVTLRKTGGGTWYLWEQNLLSDIRIPKSQDAWA
ncbi:MAG: hypothetical protein IKC32_04855 [Clostridia bacterium]|nr:hypothetical protein [Clostridia bacterium]